LYWPILLSKAGTGMYCIGDIQPYNFGWFFFGILFVYYFLFESLFSKTPGKWFSYSKVVNREGRKANIGWIFIRSITRIIIIDLFFIPFLGKPCMIT
jgi:uncharacterized RDD family membrane protein YckC